MGSNHSSHTNLGRDSTSFESSSTGSIARWGDFFSVGMSKWKENEKTEVYGVEYKTGQKKRGCGFQLKTTHDNNGTIESIHLGLGDTTVDNKTEFTIMITRVARDGLRGGIIGIDSSTSPITSTRTKNDYSIETTIVPYGCSYRDGLFVLEMKKKGNSENACTVTLAHYYVTKEMGLSVTAKICRKGNSFIVEVEGPCKHPSSDLRKVIVKTTRTGIWSPGACSHCKAAKAISSTSGGASNSTLKGQSGQQSDGKVDAIVKHAVFSSNVREQKMTGLINSSGYTSGSFNHSIIFINCNV